MSEDYEIIVKSPRCCSDNERKIFKRLVIKGDEVMVSGLDERIYRACYLAWVTVGADTVGVAALKNPNENYRSHVFKAAELNERPDGWKYELGWIYVEKSYRRNGFGKELVLQLLSKDIDGNVYSTAREDNRKIEKLLGAIGFKKVEIRTIPERATASWCYI